MLVGAPPPWRRQPPSTPRQTSAVKLDRPPLRTTPGFEEDPTLGENGAKNKTNPFSPEVRERAWYANRPVCKADKVWKQMNREGIRAARRTIERVMKRLGLRDFARWFASPVVDATSHIVTRGLPLRRIAHPCVSKRAFSQSQHTLPHNRREAWRKYDCFRDWPS
ncbi:IS3 family transposase [Ralstonia solanacearum]|uniref:IS3 family transposase n=1 Tax=Ralstonia solanacearum TaxID=305 RepID=UPI0035EBD77B